MADKLSSPSSSSTNGGGSSSNQATPPKNGPQRSDDESYLFWRKQPPSYAYDDETFEISVSLEVPQSRRSTESPLDHTDVEILASIRHHPHPSSSSNRPTTIPSAAGGNNDDHPTTATLVVLNNDSPPSSSRGGSTATTRPLLVSAAKPCNIHCKIRTMEPLRREKRTCYVICLAARHPTRAIATTISTPIQLVSYKIRIVTDDSWSNIWYKDEGGRDKSMEVMAELIAKNNAPHRERIPLRLTLYYAPASEDQGPVQVTNQEILRLLGNSAKLHTDKSTGKATVRFRIEDVSKNHQGQDFLVQISPDTRKGFVDIAPGFTPSVSVRSKRNKRQRSSHQSQITGGSSRRSSTSPSHEETSSGGPFGPPSRTIWGPEGVNTADPNRLREAMQGVMHWTEEVVNGLYPLQWQILGYAQHPDGSPDYNHPHYSMTNPNAYISRILSLYSESTRENLWIISQAVEQAANPSAGSASQQPPEAYARMQERSPEDRGYSMAPSHRVPPLAPPHAAVGHVPPGMIPHPGPRPLVGVSGGMHPTVASEAFRPKPGMGESQRDQPTPAQSQQQQPYPPMMPYASPHMGRPRFPQHPFPQQYFNRPPQPPPQQQRRIMDETEAAFLSEPIPPPSLRAVGAEDSKPAYERDVAETADPRSRESEVEYVLAKQHKAFRTGEPLGFPAYSESRELVGFYRESRSKVGVGEFIPISQHAEDFGPMEIMQATEILNKAIASKSSAVHALKDWGSISSLIDHALLYGWTKDMGSSGSAPGNSQSGSEGGE